MVACLSIPERVTQSNWNFTVDVAVVIADVVAAPTTLVLEELRAVKSDWSGLETVQDCMPLVTQPMSDVFPDSTVFGFATRIIDGRPTSILHCATDVAPLFVQVRPYVAV